MYIEYETPAGYNILSVLKYDSETKIQWELQMITKEFKLAVPAKILYENRQLFFQGGSGCNYVNSSS